MYKYLPMIALFALLGCAGSKPPVAEQAANVAVDDEKCKIMQEVRDYAKSQNLDMNQKYPFDDNEKCFCAETIICGGKSTCYAVECND